MEEQQKKGCGCGSNVSANVQMANSNTLNDKQYNLMRRIKKTTQRFNKTYKTSNAIFM